MIAWLAFAAAAAAAPSSVELSCSMTDVAPAEEETAAAPVDDDPTPLTITLQQSGRRISAVLVDGPPILSSYAGLEVFTGTPDPEGGVRIQKQQLPKRDQWRGKYRKDVIELRRGGSSITLTPTSDASYSGSWSFHEVFEGHVHMNGGGEMRCQRRAASGSNPS